MLTKTDSKIKKEKFVSLPFTLEQVGLFLSQLSKADFEVLEELMDKKFQKLILTRGGDIISQFKKGETIPLKRLQKEF